MSIQCTFRQLLCGHCILVILGLLTLVACQQDRPHAPPRSPLRVGWHTWPGYFPIAIAVHLNLFAKHGVTVEPILYESAVSSHPDLQAGKLDGATGTLADALLMDGRSPDNVRVVLVADYSAGGDVVVATADIATVADLRGKRIGARLGSFSELFVLTMLQMHDLTRDEVTLLKVEPQDVPTAIRSRDLSHSRHQNTPRRHPRLYRSLARSSRLLASSPRRKPCRGCARHGDGPEANHR
jgi:NitT/TauT family transport system substrate-binding protein